MSFLGCGFDLIQGERCSETSQGGATEYIPLGLLEHNESLDLLEHASIAQEEEKLGNCSEKKPLASQ